MKIKTNVAKETALDWAVAKCEGHEVAISRGGWVVFDTHQDCPPPVNDYDDSRWQTYSPSTNWAQGGPIIEQEKLSLDLTDDVFDHGTNSAVLLDQPEWWASIEEYTGRGPTPLIAAMRCYVAAKLGDEIDVPDELMLEIGKKGERNV